MGEDGSEKALVEVAKAAAQVVPKVYEDGLQPGVKELGQALQKALNLVATPIYGLAELKEIVADGLRARFRNKSPEQLVPPPLPLLGNVFEGLRYSYEVDEIREMYLNLLASAMDVETVPIAHPAFAEIIRQLTPDEAKIVGKFGSLQNDSLMFPLLSVKVGGFPNKGYRYLIRDFSELPWLAECKCPENAFTYMDNLLRLNLVELLPGIHLTNTSRYQALEEHASVKSALASCEEWIRRENLSVEYEHRVGAVSAFGQSFYNACVREDLDSKPKDAPNPPSQ